MGGFEASMLFSWEMNLGESRAIIMSRLFYMIAIEHVAMKE